MKMEVVKTYDLPEDRADFLIDFNARELYFAHQSIKDVLRRQRKYEAFPDIESLVKEISKCLLEEVMFE